MTRYMFDSDVAADVPSAAPIAAGYVDGSGTFKTLAKIRPHAKLLSISIHGALAKCYDMENGALTIATGVACAKRDIAAGDMWPWLYFSTSNYAAVKAECQKVGIWGKVILFGAHYKLTDAQATALIKSGQGYYAIQNVAPNYGATGHWDRSVLAAYIPGFDPKPAPKPTPMHAASRKHTSELTRALKGRKVHPVVAADDKDLAELDTEIQRVRKLK